MPKYCQSFFQFLDSCKVLTFYYMGGQICPTLLKSVCNFWAVRPKMLKFTTFNIFSYPSVITQKNRKKLKGGHLGGRSEVIPENQNLHFLQFFTKRSIYQRILNFGCTFHFCACDGLSKKIDQSFRDSRYDLEYILK